MGQESAVRDPEPKKAEPQVLKVDSSVEEATPVEMVDRTGVAETTARTNLSADSQDVSASRAQASQELNRIMDSVLGLPDLAVADSTFNLRRDAAGRIEEVTDAKGNKFKFGRDEQGNITSFTDNTGDEYTSKNGFNFVNGKGQKLNGVFGVDEDTGSIHFMGMEGHFEWKQNGDAVATPIKPVDAVQPHLHVLPTEERLNNAAKALADITRGIDEGNTRWLGNNNDKLSATALAIIKDNRVDLDALRAAYKAQNPNGDLDKDLLSRVTGLDRDRLEKLFKCKTQTEFDAWDIGNSLKKIDAKQDKATAERILRETLNGRTPEEIEAIDAKFREDNGISLAKALEDKDISRGTRGALVELLKNDHPDLKASKLGQIAIGNQDFQMFQEAFRNASPAAREEFAKVHGHKLAEAFKGQETEAREYLANGELSLATRIRENRFGWNTEIPLVGDLANFTNKPAIEHLLSNMSDKQHVDYIAGSQLQGKSEGLTPEQVRQRDFYKNVSDALKETGSATDFHKWNDMAMNGGSLVSEIVAKKDQRKDAIFTAIEEIKKVDFDRLHDPNNPHFRQQVVDVLGTILGGKDLQRAIGLLDQQVNSPEDNYGNPNARRSVLETLQDRTAMPPVKGEGVVNAIARMSPEELDRFKNEPAFRKQIEDIVGRSMDPRGYNGEQASELRQYKLVTDRLVEKLKKGESPELGPTERVIIAARKDTDRIKLAADIEAAYKADPTLRERVNNPQTEEDKLISRSFNDAFDKNFTRNQLPLIDIDDYRSLLTQGSLSLDLRIGLQKNYGGKLLEMSKATEAERQQLLASNPEYAFKNMTPEQRQLAEKVLKQGELNPEDTMRAFVVGGSGVTENNIQGMLDKMTPAQVQAMKERYEKDYGKNLLGDLLPKVDEDKFAALESRLARQISPREMVADIVSRDEASKSGLAGLLATYRDGTTMQSGEAVSGFLKSVQNSESFKNMTPEMQAQVRQYIETSFAQQRATKEEITEIAINTAVIGASVALAPLTAGQSLTYQLGAAAAFGLAGAATQTVGRAQMMGQEYDPSTRWRDGAKGFIEGATGNIGVPGLNIAGRGGYLIKAGADGAVSGAIASAATAPTEWDYNKSWEDNVATITKSILDNTAYGAAGGVGFAAIIGTASKVVARSAGRNLDTPDVSPVLTPGSGLDLPQPPARPSVATPEGTYFQDGNVYRNDKGETISNIRRDADGSVSYKIDRDGAQVHIDGATKNVVESRVNPSDGSITESQFKPGSTEPSAIVIYSVDASGTRTAAQRFMNQDGNWVNIRGEAIGTRAGVEADGIINFSGKPTGTKLAKPSVDQKLDEAGDTTPVSYISVRSDGLISATGTSPFGRVEYTFDATGKLQKFDSYGVKAEFEYDPALGDVPAKVTINGNAYTRRVADGVYVDEDGFTFAKSIEARGGSITVLPTDTYRWPGEENTNRPIEKIEFRATGWWSRKYVDQDGLTVVPGDQPSPFTTRERNFEEKKTDFLKPSTDARGNPVEIEDLGNASVVRDTAGNVLEVRNADGTEVKFQGKDRSNLDSAEYWKDGKLQYSVQKNGNHFERVYPDGTREALTIDGRPVDRVSMNNDGATTHYSTYEKIGADGKPFKTWQAERTGTDGVKVRIDENGRERVGAEDYEKLKSRFNELNQRFTTPDFNRMQRLQNLMQEWEANATRNGVSREQIANVYHNMNKMLSTDDAVLPTMHRERLVEQFALSLAKNDHIDQGFWSTCNVTASHETRGMVHNPDVMADMLAQVATTGRYITQSGHIIDIKESAGTMLPQSVDADLKLRPTGGDDPLWDVNDLRDLTAHKKNGGRSYSDQILQTTLVNLYWQQQTSFPDGPPRQFRGAMTVDQLRAGEPYRPADLRYEIGTVKNAQGQPIKSVENITDYSKTPPEPMTTAQFNNGFDPLTPNITRSSGVETPINAPRLDYDMILGIDKLLYGPKANTDYLLVAGAKDKPYNVGSADDLLKRLQAAPPDTYPMTIAVDSRSVKQTEGETPTGGEHVVNVHNIYQAPDGTWMAYVTNQWGEKYDRLEKRPIPVSELWEWMRRDIQRPPNDAPDTVAAHALDTQSTSPRPTYDAATVTDAGLQRIKNNQPSINSDPELKSAYNRYQSALKQFRDGAPINELRFLQSLSLQRELPSKRFTELLQYATARLNTHKTISSMEPSTTREAIEQTLNTGAMKNFKEKGDAAFEEARQVQMVAHLLSNKDFLKTADGQAFSELANNDFPSALAAAKHVEGTRLQRIRDEQAAKEALSQTERVEQIRQLEDPKPPKSADERLEKLTTIKDKTLVRQELTWARETLDITRQNLTDDLISAVGDVPNAEQLRDMIVRSDLSPLALATYAEQIRNNAVSSSDIADYVSKNRHPGRMFPGTESNAEYERLITDMVVSSHVAQANAADEPGMSSYTAQVRKFIEDNMNGIREGRNVPVLIDGTVGATYEFGERGLATPVNPAGRGSVCSAATAVEGMNRTWSPAKLLEHIVPGSRTRPPLRYEDHASVGNQRSDQHFLTTIVPIRDGLPIMTAEHYQSHFGDKSGEGGMDTVVNKHIKRIDPTNGLPDGNYQITEPEGSQAHVYFVQVKNQIAQVYDAQYGERQIAVYDLRDFKQLSDLAERDRGRTTSADGIRFGFELAVWQPKRNWLPE